MPVLPQLVMEVGKIDLPHAIEVGAWIGLVMAIMKMSSLRPYRWFAAVYIEIFRGLPADHPFFGHPRIILTPHVASMTQPATACEVFLANLRRYQQGLGLTDVVDRARGY